MGLFFLCSLVFVVVSIFSSLGGKCSPSYPQLITFLIYFGIFFIPFINILFSIKKSNISKQDNHPQQNVTLQKGTPTSSQEIEAFSQHTQQIQSMQ